MAESHKSAGKAPESQAPSSAFDPQRSGSTANLLPATPARGGPSSASPFPANSGTGFGAAGLTVTDDAPRRYGRGPIKYDERKFRYDVLTGMESPASWSTDKEDRMSASQAGEKLHQIHVLYGVDRESFGFLHSYDRALFFQHTINGGSVVQPGRAKITIEGTEFDMYPIITALGVDYRRFYRAFADEVTEANRQVIRDYDPYDPVKAEQHAWLMQVATERGLQRYPWLAHDSADACQNVSQEERFALMASKAMVLSTTSNVVDNTRVTSRVAAPARQNVREDVHTAPFS